MAGELHIVMVPVPAQGHVAPLMQLSHILAKQGFRITFVSSDYNRNTIPASDDDDDGDSAGGVSLVSVSDGLQADEDRNDLDKLASALYITMPANLGSLLGKMMEDGCTVDCVVADLNLTGVIKVARELGIPTAGFWPASASTLLASSNLQKLIHEGVVDEDGGTLMNQDWNEYSALTSPMDSKNFFWSRMGDKCAQKNCFEVAHRIGETVETLEWVICNSAYDLEPKVFNKLAPNIKPIGPLSMITNQSNHPQKVLTNVWPEDDTCLKWLDQQPPKSVIFAAFGSITTLGEEQFKELALGLELSNKPFLWVVRPNITVETQLESYLQGFRNQIACRGQLVGWAPQQKVLGHEAIACFLSHCGWNSTLEGLSNGVPFLCWPYFADQFTNESYICDLWKTGLRLEKDRDGIVSREEIKRKVEILLYDDGFKDRAQGLKKVAHNSVTQGGLSRENLQAFTKWLKHM